MFNKEGWYWFKVIDYGDRKIRTVRKIRHVFRQFGFKMPLRYIRDMIQKNEVFHVKGDICASLVFTFNGETEISYEFGIEEE